MTSTKINQLQLLQQNLQNTVVQKQQVQSHIAELDSALTELKTTEKSYQILGKIMVAVPQEKLKKELQEEKDSMNIRLKNLVQQEERMQADIEESQQEVMKELKQEKKD